MSSGAMGLIIGGVIPAILYGVFPIFMKFSGTHQLSVSMGIVMVGLSTALVGAFSIPFLEGGLGTLTGKGIAFGALGGLAWGTGALLVSIAILRYGIPVAQITPMFNMNTLVAMLLGLWIFAEWKTAQVMPLLIGALLITVGGIVISRA